jgi:hypothetical protein
MKFEKMHGNREGIEDVVVGQRRFKYEEEVSKNPLNYDTWFDYIRLEENAGDMAKTREVYERAIANVPPANEKRFWRFRDVRGRARAYARALRASSRAYEARQGMDVLRALRSNTDCCCG